MNAHEIAQAIVRHRQNIRDTRERIAWLYLEQGSGELPWVEINETFREREAYQEGSLTELPDLSIYETPPDHE